MSEPLPFQHWSEFNPCGGCGAVSNTSHVVGCYNYGLYDKKGNRIRAIPKVEARIQLSQEDLVTRADLYAILVGLGVSPIWSVETAMDRHNSRGPVYKPNVREQSMTHPEASPILRYFDYLHLPEHLQDVSRPFAELAARIENILPAGPEKSVALRKLLEAKDAAVRARL